MFVYSIPRLPSFISVFLACDCGSPSLYVFVECLCVAAMHITFSHLSSNTAES